MKSVVTGGAGFIGSNLVDQLVDRGHKVTVLDDFSTGRKSNLKQHSKKKIKVVKIDISKNKNLTKYFKEVDYVFHLAGKTSVVESLKKPKLYFKVNVNGTLNLIKSIKRFNIKKFIYAASASCYGIPKELPTKENSKIKPSSPYAHSKYLAEKLIMHEVKKNNFPANSLRFFNVYGPRLSAAGSYSSVFGAFLSQKVANKPLTIIGNGNQTRDFIHVKDLVNVIIKAAFSKKIGNIYNVGSGIEVKINKVADIIGGKKIYLPKRKNETNRSLASIKKIKKDFNWKPKITLEKGLKNLLKDTHAKVYFN
jgi:UDP-glucose 4-epimerase